MFLILKLVSLLLGHLVSFSTSIDLLVFEEFGSSALTDFVMKGYTVDDYEVYLDMAKWSKRIPVGDLSICFSMFHDNKRFPDSGNLQIQVQLFQNESDIIGTKDYINFWDRVIPSFEGPKTTGDTYKMKNHWWNQGSPAFQKYKGTPVLKRWLQGEVRPHHWVNTCHLYDKVTNMYTLYANGEHVVTEEVRFSQDDNLWPKMEMTRFIIGSKFTSTNYVPIGKYTGINIYSRVLSKTEASEISSKIQNLCI